MYLQVIDPRFLIKDVRKGVTEDETMLSCRVGGIDYRPLISCAFMELSVSLAEPMYKG